MLEFKKEEPISLQGKVSIILFCSLVLMSFLPQLRALSFFNYLWPLNLFAWLLFSFLTNTNFFLKPTFHRLVTYTFFVYVLSISIASGNSFMANRYLEYFQLIVFLWGFEFYSANFDNKRVNEKILALLSPFVLITSINTIHMYITNPNISRTAKKDTAEGLAQMSQGIAGYDFVYFIVFIFAGLMYLSFSFDRKLLVKITLLALAALLFVNIVLSNFMIAMLLSLMVLFCRFFVYKTNKIWLLGYLTLFIIMVPAFSLLFDVLFDALIELNKGSLNEKRLLEIKLILSSGIVEASLGARLHAFELSLQAFANFPLTGIVINSIKNTSGVVTGFGQHSFLLDSFALFGGIVGSVSVYVFLAPVVQMFRERRDINYSSFPFLVCFMVLILFTVNNVTPSVGAAVFFIIPSIFSYMKRKISNELA